MATEGNTYFLRSFLLLVEGGLYILREILGREIQTAGGNLDALLKQSKNKLKHEFHGKQYDKLFPQYGTTDINRWDLQLSVGVLIRVFRHSLSETENQSLRALRDLRNEIYMHCATASLDKSEYEYVQKELKYNITHLAETFDEPVRDRCSKYITQFASGPLDGVKPSLTTLNGLSLPCQKAFKVGLHTELAVGGPSDYWINLCEHTLDTILNNATSMASEGAGFEEIEKNVKKMLEFLQDNTDVIFKGSKKGCIILMFECNSFDDVLLLLQKLDSQEFRDQLSRISVALLRHYQFDSTISISARVRTEDLQSILIAILKMSRSENVTLRHLEVSSENKVDDKDEHAKPMQGSEEEVSQKAESKQPLKLNLECTSKDGLFHILNSFQKEDLSGHLKSVADALSNYFGKNITLKASLDIEDVLEAIEEAVSTHSTQCIALQHDSEATDLNEHVSESDSFSVSSDSTQCIALQQDSEATDLKEDVSESDSSSVSTDSTQCIALQHDSEATNLNEHVSESDSFSVSTDSTQCIALQHDSEATDLKEDVSESDSFSDKQEPTVNYISQYKPALCSVKGELDEDFDKEACLPDSSSEKRVISLVASSNQKQFKKELNMATTQPSQHRVRHFRLQTLILNGSTTVIRNIIDQKSSNVPFSVFLSHEKTSVNTLRASNIITLAQYKLLYPEAGNPLAISDIDLTLATCLLRSLQGFGLNTNYNWSATPQQTDTSLEADLSRLRNIRDEIEHIASTAEITQATYMNTWNEVEKVLHRLNNSVPNPIQNLQQELDEYKNNFLDPEAEENIQEEIEKLQEMERNLEMEMQIVKKEFEEVPRDSTQCMALQHDPEATDLHNDESESDSFSDKQEPTVNYISQYKPALCSVRGKLDEDFDIEACLPDSSSEKRVISQVASSKQKQFKKELNMATAQPPQHRVRHFRLQTLIIDGGTTVVRNIIDQKSSNVPFNVLLNQEKTSVNTLSASKVITLTQYTLLYPKGGNPPSISDIDLTLSMCLLRSLKRFGLNTKYNWSTTPQQTDTSLEADLSRLRNTRNEIEHIASTAEITQATYMNTWNEIEKVLHRLNNSVPNPIQNLQQELDEYRNKPLDPEAEKKIQEEIEKLQEMERNLDMEKQTVKEEFEEDVSDRLAKELPSKFQTLHMEMPMCQIKEEKPLKITKCLHVATPEVDVRENMDIVLSCEVNRYTNEAVWQHNGQVIKPCNRRVVSIDYLEHKLTIRNAKFEDEGDYTIAFADDTSRIKLIINGNSFSHKIQLSDELYKNWIRGALGLKYLKIGLERFSDTTVSKHHSEILTRLPTNANTCTNCTETLLLPLHAKGNCPNKSKCLCLKKPHYRKLCPNGGFCSAFHDQILADHRFNDPLLLNTDIQKWSSDPWSVATCYINTPGYKGKGSAKYVDCAGLLSIFINNTFFHRSLGDVLIDGETDLFKQARNARNDILHNPNYELSEGQLHDYIDLFIKTLEIKDINGRSPLSNQRDVQVAIKTLNELRDKKIEVHVFEDLQRQISDLHEHAMSELANKLHDAIQQNYIKVQLLEEKLKKTEKELQLMNDLRSTQIESKESAPFELELHIRVVGPTSETRTEGNQRIYKSMNEYTNTLSIDADTPVHSTDQCVHRLLGYINTIEDCKIIDVLNTDVSVNIKIHCFSCKAIADFLESINRNEFLKETVMLRKSLEMLEHINVQDVIVSCSSESIEMTKKLLAG